ncbi:MAG: isoprenylcysteine carboxylmethyltransferase family protein [Deltaproteobacteria bacterium]|nr:isoprenylcysteine carboxylmethyltransferase family protein [Deltaproteobacteria bacterium]
MPLSKVPSHTSTPLKNFQIVFLLLFALIFLIQGWGDRQGLLAHPARAGFVAVLALNVLALLFVPFELFESGEREVRRQRWPTFAALGFVGVCLWFLPHADKNGLWVWAENDLLRYTGLTGVVCGTGLRVAAMAQLGPLFSTFVTVQKEHVLVTAGLYHWVRHPIYTGSLVAVVGVFLVFRSQLLWVAVPVYLVGTLWRIRDEEALLGEAFGEAYQHYRARTWRLLPLVY